MARTFSVSNVTRLMTIVLVAPLLAVGIAVPAGSTTDGLWYVDALKVRPHHAAGITGAGVNIAVIDTRINPSVPTLLDADIQVREPSFCLDEAGAPLSAATTELSPLVQTDHGTNVVSMIVGSGAGYPGQTGVTGVAPGATVSFYAIAGPSDPEVEGIQCLDQDGYNTTMVGSAIIEALDDGADIISISLSGGLEGNIIPAMARAYREGVPIVSGVYNTFDVMDTGMPGRSNGAVTVQAAGPTGEIQSSDGSLNKNVETDVVAPGTGITIQGDRSSGVWETQTTTSGTSLSTPVVAGFLALAKQKYPNATGNQLIQSLIRNTSGEPDHEPYYDPEQLYGYGLINIDNLLGADPTGYPDINPLINKTTATDVDIPTYDEIFNPETAAEPTNAPEPTEPESSNGFVIAAITAGVIALFLLLALMVIVILVRRKARGVRQSGSQEPENSHG